MFRFVLEDGDRTDALEDVVSIEAAATNSVVVWAHADTLPAEEEEGAVEE
jgi:hypothetical protein